MRIASVITVSGEDQTWLRQQVGSALTAQRLVERCQIVLLAAEGLDNQEIAAALGVSRQKVGRWRVRFHTSGRAGIEADAPGRGRKPVYGPEMSQLIVERTLRSRPPLATHWSRRRMSGCAWTICPMTKKVARVQCWSSVSRICRVRPG